MMDIGFAIKTKTESTNVVKPAERSLRDSAIAAKSTSVLLNTVGRVRFNTVLAKLITMFFGVVRAISVELIRSLFRVTNSSGNWRNAIHELVIDSRLAFYGANEGDPRLPPPRWNRGSRSALYALERLCRVYRFLVCLEPQSEQFVESRCAIPGQLSHNGLHHDQLTECHADLWLQLDRLNSSVGPAQQCSASATSNNAPDIMEKMRCE